MAVHAVRARIGVAARTMFFSGSDCGLRTGVCLWLTLFCIIIAHIVVAVVLSSSPTLYPSPPKPAVAPLSRPGTGSTPVVESFTFFLATSSSSEVAPASWSPTMNSARLMDILLIYDTSRWCMLAVIPLVGPGSSSASSSQRFLTPTTQVEALVECVVGLRQAE